MSLTVVLLVIGPASSANAYERPPAGKWAFQNLFGDTKRGAFALGEKHGATVIRKLVLVVGDSDREACGKRIRLVSKPRLRSYRQFNGRWAFARVSKGLFAPKAVTIQVDGKERRGRLIVLFDETGRLAPTGDVMYRGCHLRFFARKNS